MQQQQSKMTRSQKKEGSISDIFTSLNPDGFGKAALPDRFIDLKKSLWNAGLVQSWRDVLGELEVATSVLVERKKRGVDVIPKISYEELKGGLSKSLAEEIKRVGSVVVTGAVPKEEALGWKRSIQEYASLNKDRVKGFPANDIQVYELYNTKPQLLARTHPAILHTQAALLALWHTGTSSSNISLSTPISYSDRLRIRQPGDASFKLGPHVDGGSVEKWEDPGFRAYYAKILGGGSGWREHDSFDAGSRTLVKGDLYETANQCSIFRPFQGWTALSNTGPGEGTLRVFPNLQLSTAYTLLRPFFRPRNASSSSSFDAEDWVPDLESSAFPGSMPGNTQEYTDGTHPHLRLEEAMVEIGRVEAGDQVYWHCDTIHSVESFHGGKTDSSVLYIPAVPLTLQNADYLRDQRIAFEQGIPPPDFPGGEGESQCQGRATKEDALGLSLEGRRALGYAEFVAGEGLDEGFVREVNRVLGF